MGRYPDEKEVNQLGTSIRYLTLLTIIPRLVGQPNLASTSDLPGTRITVLGWLVSIPTRFMHPCIMTIIYPNKCMPTTSMIVIRESHSFQRLKPPSWVEHNSDPT